METKEQVSREVRCSSVECLLKAFWNKGIFFNGKRLAYLPLNFAVSIGSTEAPRVLVLELLQKYGYQYSEIAQAVMNLQQNPDWYIASPCKDVLSLDYLMIALRKMHELRKYVQNASAPLEAQYKYLHIQPKLASAKKQKSYADVALTDLFSAEELQGMEIDSAELEQRQAEPYDVQ